MKYFKETRDWRSACKIRAVFRTQSSIYDGDFLQKASSQMFDWVLKYAFEKTETFKIKLRLAKSSRLLQRSKFLVFHWNNSTSFESIFYMKTVKSRLFKKYLKGRKSRAQFCLSLGWLHISEKNYWKLQLCWCRSS